MLAVDLRFLRQPEHPLADDVALHLVGAAGDARRGCGEDAEGPARVARVLPRLAAGAGDRDAEVGRAPGELGAGELADGASGSRRLARLHRGAGPLPDVAHDLRPDVDVGDALAHDRVVEPRRAGGRGR